MAACGDNLAVRVQDASMSVTQCRFCDHVNPAGSKFCSECGGALHLLPCPHCGAVSQVTATVCYQCHAQLPWHTAESFTSAASSAAASKPSIRWRSTAIIGAAVVAAIAVLGYYGQRPAPLAEPAGLPAAGVAASGAVVRTDGVAQEPIEAAPDAIAPESAIVEIPSAVPPTTSTKPSSRSAQPAKPPGTTAAVERNRLAAPASQGRIAQPTPSRVESCTEPVAALGLCTLKPAQDKITDTTVTRVGKIPVQALDGAKKEAGPDSIRQESCPEAQQALGLCTPRLSQGGN